MAPANNRSTKRDRPRDRKVAPPAQDPAPTRDRNTWVVGVGASAGGLAALQEFLGHLPTDNALAVIVAQHLDPQRESALVEILARATSLRVTQASDGMALAPGTVSVVPRNVQGALRDGLLRLDESEPGSGRRSIDHLLSSLASDAGEHAVAVILSGTGSDGSEGLIAVHQIGGMTFAQTEDSAQFADMPRHAIATGCVDLVLPPAAIATELARMTRAAAASAASPAEGLAAATHDSFDTARTLDLVRSVTGVDLGGLSTRHVERRLARRALLSGVERPSDYMAMLTASPAEVASLGRDLLIGVTSFFRDPDAFAALRERVLPGLVDRRDRDDPIRIWVPACASGEEAYSIAMALADFCEQRGRRMGFQIFGTDVNEAAVAAARAGVYREAALTALPAGFASRFFKRTGDGFQIESELRERCVFAAHNVFTDPPLSHLDLISCRNLLIYLGQSAQQRLLATFQFALEPDGILFLGASESVGAGGELFAPIDRRHRLFSRKPGPSRLPSRRGTGPVAPSAAGLQAVRAPRSPAPGSSVPPGAVADALLDHFAPKDFVVVNSDFEVLRFHGKVGRFLAPATGEASLNLLRLVPQDLALDVRVLLHEAREKGGRATKQRVVPFGSERTADRVTIEAIPVPSRDEGEGLTIIAFRSEDHASATVPATTPEGPAGSRADALQDELTLTRELLRQVVDDQDTVRDDAQTANVELQSTNEELQTTNEELETAKEELQATNEELHTVNQELQVRNQELNQLNADLNNLITSAEIPIVMLDAELRIRRCTPSAVALLRISPQDVGRDARDLLADGSLGAVFPLLRDVLAGRPASDLEIEDKDGRWYVARFRPYLDVESRIDGVVLSFIDVDTIRRSLAAANAARDYARAVVETVRSPLVELDTALCVQAANPCFHDTFGTSADELIGHALFDRVDGGEGMAAARRELGALLAGAREIRDLEVEFSPRGGAPRTLVLDAREIQGGSAGERRILVAVQDVTAERVLADALRERADALVAADQAKDSFLAGLSHELRTPLAAIVGWSQIALEADLPSGEQDAALRSILRNGLALAGLVADLLDVSRVLNGNLTLQLEPVDLGALLHDSVDAVTPAANAKSITIDVVDPGSLQPVPADRNRMRQVIVNLLSNAVRFTPEGGSIRLELRDGRSEQTIVVTDDGEGMTSDQLSRIFQRYYQATPDGRTGLGLGLSLVRDLVALHGGTVEAASAGPGHGSTFAVHVPVPRL
jgi:two-component system CheB/CheR fusion protein